MKKFALLALTLSAMLTFTACGSQKAEAPAPETTVEASAEAEAPASDVVVETVSETEKVAKLADEEGTQTATLTLENGTPAAIAFDFINADGSSKYEAAKSGAYSMGETSTPWNEQADALAAFLKENNFDVTKVTLSDEDGHTDAVTGVSIKIPAMLKAAEAVLNN